MNLRGWGLQEVSDCISDWRKSRGVLFRTSRDVCVRHHAGGSLSAESSLQAWTQACPGKGSWHSGTHPPGSTAKTPKHIFCNQSYFQLPLPVIWFMDLEKWPAPQHMSAQKPLPFHLLWTHACLAQLVELVQDTHVEEASFHPSPTGGLHCPATAACCAWAAL